MVPLVAQDVARATQRVIPTLWGRACDFALGLESVTGIRKQHGVDRQESTNEENHHSRKRWFLVCLATLGLGLERARLLGADSWLTVARGTAGIVFRAVPPP